MPLRVRSMEGLAVHIEPDLSQNVLPRNQCETEHSVALAERVETDRGGACFICGDDGFTEVSRNENASQSGHFHFVLKTGQPQVFLNLIDLDSARVAELEFNYNHLTIRSLDQDVGNPSVNHGSASDAMLCLLQQWCPQCLDLQLKLSFVVYVEYGQGANIRFSDRSVLETVQNAGVELRQNCAQATAGDTEVVASRMLPLV